MSDALGRVLLMRRMETKVPGADDESPEDMCQTFQTCLEAGEEGAGGAGAFATEDEIRDCFIEAGYVPGTDDDNDEEENEDDDEETNN